MQPDDKIVLLIRKQLEAATAQVEASLASRRIKPTGVMKSLSVHGLQDVAFYEETAPLHELIATLQELAAEASGAPST